jgi:hypothetical protein
MSGRSYQEKRSGEACVHVVPGPSGAGPCGRLAVTDYYDHNNKRYPKCALHAPPRDMTPGELEVIEAAKAWRAGASVHRLAAALDALPKPEPTLVERLREAAETAHPEHKAQLMREAADEIEHLAKLLSEEGAVVR